MATTINVTVDVKAAASRLKNYQRNKLPRAVKQSVNTAIKGGRTDVTNALKKRITMPVRAIQNRIKVVQAKGSSINTIVAKLSVPPRRAGKEFSNLGSFKLQKVRKSVKGKRRLSASGVGARVWGEKKYKKYEGAFVWTRAGAAEGSSAVTVFRRVRNAPKVKPSKRIGGSGGDMGIRKHKRGPKKGQVILRQPIKPVWGASVTREFVRRNRTDIRVAAIDVVRVQIRRRFIKELDRQLRRLK